MTTLEYFQAKLDATISPRGVTALRDHRPDSFVIVDVRIGPVPTVIPRAVRIPEPEISARMSELPKDKLLILYCWETWCSLAAKSAIPFLQAGHSVKELYGGIAAWESLHLPTDVIARPAAISCDC